MGLDNSENSFIGKTYPSYQRSYTINGLLDPVHFQCLFSADGVATTAFLKMFPK